MSKSSKQIRSLEVEAINRALVNRYQQMKEQAPSKEKPMPKTDPLVPDAHRRVDMGRAKDMLVRLLKKDR